MLIRPARPKDHAALWSILEPVIRAGETYALDRAMGRDAALEYWLGGDKRTFVAEAAGMVLGTYYLRPNQSGGGAHVCNCGYMTSPQATGRGVARAMALDSIDRARALGYLAIQFNLVVSTNVRAVRLWQSIGFDIVGTLPRAFDHPVHGLVDAFVMYQQL